MNFEQIPSPEARRKLKISVTKGMPSGMAMDIGLDYARVDIVDQAKRDPYFICLALEKILEMQLSDKVEELDTESGQLKMFIPYDKKDKATLKRFKELLEPKTLANAADEIEKEMMKKRVQE